MNKMVKGRLEIISSEFTQKEIVGRPDGWRNLCFQVGVCEHARDPQIFQEYCEYKGEDCPYKDKKGEENGNN